MLPCLYHNIIMFIFHILFRLFLYVYTYNVYGDGHVCILKTKLYVLDFVSLISLVKVWPTLQVNRREVFLLE